MKKILLVLVILIVSVIFLGVRCEDISDINQFLRSETTTVEEVTKEEVDEFTLILWERNDVQKPFLELYDRFQRDSNWKIKIERFTRPFEQNVLYKWEEGKRPDIIDFHLTTVLFPGNNWFSKLDPEKNVISLSNMEFVGNMKYNLLDSVTTMEGDVLGTVIIHPIMLGVVYNKEIFKENSFKIPKNYEEFYNLCEKIKNKGVTPIYVPWMDPEHLTYYSMFWTDVYKDDPVWWNKINSGEADFEQPAILNGLEALKKLIEAGYFQPYITEGTWKESHEKLMDDEVAMVFQEDRFLWDLVRIYGIEEVNKKIGMFGLSMNSNTVSWLLHAPGAGYAIPITGDNKKEEGSREFINYITSNGYQEFIDDLQIPPVFESFEMPEFTIDSYREILEYYNKDSYPVFCYGLKASWGPLEVFMQELFTGASSPELIAKKMSSNFKIDAKERGILE